ncbi:MAG: hypothetical protein M1834_003155 [Cirrosporium novae-zelandiae]|nr:MAG: hypothetical protein M1834_003155 [Cirrosporium novae-zelandiae]
MSKDQLSDTSDDTSEKTASGDSDHPDETSWGEPRAVYEHNVAGELRELNRVLTQHSTKSRRQNSYDVEANRYSHSSDTIPVNDKQDDDGYNWLADTLNGYTTDRKKHRHPDKSLGVKFLDVTVTGIASDVVFGNTILSTMDIPGVIRQARMPQPKKTILDHISGHVAAGEMCLVLGRPGSGCTSLLKVLANHRHSFASVTGDVTYGGMSAKEASRYRGQIVMNTEEELHFPTLTVGQTMDFALSLKTPHLRFPGVTSAQFNASFKELYLKMFGISHTVSTKVGNEYIRGVSGGERKRVSIAEIMVTRATTMCWDNSTRGLDASTALDYTKCLRIMTDIMKCTNIVTLYQAGNKIYDLFDKVLIVDSGRCIYFGPQADARGYFEDMGFICVPGSNVADFLTGVTVKSERKIQPGCVVPDTVEEFEQRYKESKYYKEAMDELQDMGGDSANEKEMLENFKEAAQKEKAKHVPPKEPYTTSLWKQIKTCTIRQYQLMWGDKSSMIIKQGSTLAQALIAGSLFYDLPQNTTGLFTRGGALFMAFLFNALLGMAEVTESFSSRPIMIKHKQFAFYRPAALAISQVLSDVPLMLFQLSHFSLVLYFMCGFKVNAGNFFIFYLIIFVGSLCMNAFFRMVAAGVSTFDKASELAGTGLSILVMYTGFIIPKPSMHPWLSWLYWLNPMHYGYEALMVNEFHNTNFTCAGDSLIPQGPSYPGDQNKGCGVPGAIDGTLIVDGDAYLKLSYKYQYSHLWRNFGIIIGFWIFFVVLTMIGMERQRDLHAGASLVYRRPAPWFVRKLKALIKKDNQKQAVGQPQLIRNEAIFMWDQLNYTVNVPGGKKQLLDDVKGWVKPGQLTALMGSSGAGKTTLLDVLAQRKDEGEITGEILIDGRPPTISFQRSAGYCEQLDIHENTATVREALEFSALLRQPRTVPEAEKIAYVNIILDLLEMGDIENAIIGVPGAGLTVEQRKRVTIGVELAAKPEIVIFLDEPTSGLDGQSAFNTLRFMRKLAEAGQSVLCTIHQPSQSLFEQFDNLLLLARGGKTVYFGETGDKSSILKSYFARYGASCPPDVNPAEHMIDVVSGNASQGKDWNKIWLSSPEYTQVCQELEHLKQDCLSRPPTVGEDGHEYSMPLWYQCKLVLKRTSAALFRNNDYIFNKFTIHIAGALLNGFSFWKLGSSVADLKNVLFTVFTFIFVSPGVINQLQPLFLHRRDIFEAREKKSKMYSWKAFVFGLTVAEVPYLIICAVLYFVCWYYTVGFPNDSSIAGPLFLQMVLFEFLYTGIGQFISAYAPNEYFASLTTPLLMSILISFCGVLVPYSAIISFWRHWVYWINPFNYLMGGLLTGPVWDKTVKCTTSELARFVPPINQTCGEYLTAFLSTSSGYIVDPSVTAPSQCEFCKYSKGSDYLKTLNITKKSSGWRDIGITAIFCVSSYALVFVLMKLRSKKTKSAKAPE